IGNISICAISLTCLAMFPRDLRFTAVACGFSAVYLPFYGVMIPQRVARAFGMRGWDIFQPLLRPLAAAGLCTPLLVIFIVKVERWDLAWIALAACTYSLAYLVLAWSFVMDPPSRLRVVAAIGGWWRPVLDVGMRQS